MGWEMLPPKYDEDRGDWPTGTRCSSDDLYSKSEVKKSVKSYVSKEKYDQLRTRNAELEKENNRLQDVYIDRSNELLAQRDELRTRSSELEAEVERLRKALEWYSEKAFAINKFLLAKKSEAVMAVVTELSLDNGNKAKAALEASDGT